MKFVVDVNILQEATMGVLESSFDDHVFFREVLIQQVDVVDFSKPQNRILLYKQTDSKSA